MTVTREQFVREARTWLDTPYQHQGRLKGIACDCIGLVIGTARALGISQFDISDYGRRPDGRLRPVMETQLELIPVADAQPGDVLLFQWDSCPIHVAILVRDDLMIHAFLPNRRVVEMGIDDRIRMQIVAAYHVPGVV